MAQGEITLFNQFKKDLGLKIHNLDTDTYKLALVKSAANGGIDPVASTADPRWGAGGTTNLSSSEVTAGGNYSSGGISLGDVTWTDESGTMEWDAPTNPSWAVDASNPTNARWGIIYNDTATGKQAVAFVDLGADKDMTAGDLDVTWNATNGIWRF